MSKFNDFRFSGLSCKDQSNKYFTMNRISDNKNKIVVKTADEHLIETRYGYALILDHTHVVFLKSWQVSDNYFGIEVLLDHKYFNVKEWGEWDDFGEAEEKDMTFEYWLAAAKEQQKAGNEVRWEK